MSVTLDAPSLRAKSRARFGRFDPVIALTIAAFAWAVIPGFLQLQLGIRPGDTLGSASVTTPLSTLSKDLLLYVVYGLSAIAVLGSVIRRTRSGAWLLVYLAPWLALAIASFAATRSFTITSLIYLAIGLAVLDHADKIRILRVVGVLTAWVSVLSILMTLTTSQAFTSQALVPDSKAIIGSTLLNGPFYHPNTLGTVLALGFPFAFLIKRTGWRRLSLVVIAFALVWTASRTSILAVAVGLAAAGLWVAIRRLGDGSRLLLGLPQLLVYVAVIPVGVFLVATSNAKSFSARGIIWEESLALWKSRPFLGWGSDIYISISETRSAIAGLAFHGHNMWVNTLTVAGIVGAAALALVYISILVKSWRFGNIKPTTTSLTLAMWPIVFICLGWLEVPTTFFTFGYTSWAAWVPLAVVLAIPADRYARSKNTIPALSGHTGDEDHRASGELSTTVN
ncbi:O-antigen ligase family protein [Cryobacterium sp. RTC2.1]|uniref:O-antigen ligase family protein n=1 Tax=Cryobacterium sp. RTC2.1 TaxID=3048634 RepID=UPI002B23BF6F|nr:O-antigen ligase family protein [Cryobacterium sp. RTC2.1]MEB0001590.1 O-antigen ligase family protein [Cryobacterium sp. RTC2.1]